MRLTAEYITCKDGLNISVFIPSEALVLNRLRTPRGMRVEFNSEHGISLDGEEAWGSGETVALPEESLATAFMRYAFLIACIESDQQRGKHEHT